MPLGSLLDVMSHYASASFNKAVISVPRCCVLPEDMISRLAMQGKTVALSRGATLLGSILHCDFQLSWVEFCIVVHVRNKLNLAALNT